MNQHQALFDIKTMDKIVAESISDEIFYRWLIGLFAALALALAIARYLRGHFICCGSANAGPCYRLALGPDRGSLFRLVLCHTSMLVIFGVLFGVPGAVALTRTLKSFVQSVDPLDPTLLFLVSFMLAAIALMACLAPARNATRVGPNVALRYE